MDGYRLKQHRRDLSEIVRMYLLVVLLFAVGMLAWQVSRARGNVWQNATPELVHPSPNYGR